MTGKCEDISQIFFLNVGNSKEHAEKAIGELHIDKAVIISSIQLKDDVMDFIGSLTDRGVNVLETHYVDPFAPESMRDIISLILSIIERYSGHGVEFVAGLTGGTNIMAVALGVVAMIKGFRCNYVLNKDDDFLLKIDIFKELDRSVPLEQIGMFFSDVRQ